MNIKPEKKTWPPLHQAALKGDVAQLESLLISDDFDINEKDGDCGFTPLMAAVWKGHFSAVQALLKAKADPNRICANRFTALHQAVIYGSIDMVRVLLQAKARTDSVDKDGDTPLHRAVEGGKADLVRMLLASKADVTVRNWPGQTPYELAIEEGNTEIAEILVNAKKASEEEIVPAAPIAPRDEKTGSSKKTDFIFNLLNTKEEISYYMPVSALPELRDHYWQKHGISILINGCTAYGQELLNTRASDQKRLAGDAVCEWLSKSEIEQEILYVQKALKEASYSDFLGYVSTNSVAKGSKHVDIYLVSKDSVIVTPFWLDNDRLSLGVKYSSDPQVFLLEPSTALAKALVPQPQADMISCASLSFAYLKELLKKDGSQLNNLTLKFRFYTKKGDLAYFFLTSPQTLGYSQSNSYNTFLYDMVMKTTTVLFKDIEFQSLEAALLFSIDTAKAMGDLSVQEENQALLTELPNFRKQWSAAFQAMSRKRGQMEVDGHYYNLSYRALKNQHIIQASLFGKRERPLAESLACSAPYQKGFAGLSSLFKKAPEIRAKAKEDFGSESPTTVAAETSTMSFAAF